ncbi:hypothetical protein [Pusillimonas sp.]|uniref:hypothetical protein n=1 Tax=Pusillimonas sp. TaxID=3040095 RepID=UPI0029A741C6|nr:hypothetical protein [Pusillimonas sp.]MDX3895197.1 hypothetical protein [Pusillimonas sp.]
MNHLNRKLAQLFVLAALAMGPVAHAAGPGDARDRQALEGLLAAVAEQDHAAFVAPGTPDFAAITPQQFSDVARIVGPRLKQGYTAQHLGNMMQHGHEISLWKLSFKDGGDDLLATLNTQGGKVGGFFLR